jgi:uncharacterized OB-fold protein
MSPDTALARIGRSTKRGRLAPPPVHHCERCGSATDEERVPCSKHPRCCSSGTKGLASR